MSEMLHTQTDSELESEEEDEVQSSDSDSTSGNSPNCPICLLKFKGQAIGFPEVCEHPFCLDCILEWSKVTNAYPILRSFHLQYLCIFSQNVLVL